MHDFVKRTAALTEANMGKPLYAAYLKTTTEEAKLYGRYKIEVSCKPDC